MLKNTNKLTLSKLGRVINKNIKLNLVDPTMKDVYFYGNVKDIPPRFGSWKVTDIFGFDGYECMIAIEE